MLPDMPIVNHTMNDRAAWPQFVGTDVRAREVPRFDELLRFARANRRRFPLTNSDLESSAWSSAIGVLRPFRDILERFGLRAKLIELALVHDRPVSPGNVPDPAEGIDHRSFASFVASYVGDPQATQLISAYDRAIARITADGRGEAILGHATAYDYAYLFVPPSEPVDGCIPDPDPEVIGRIDEFPFSLQETAQISDPADIPKQLMASLQQELPEASRWGFALFPFRRPTITDPEMSADPYVPELFDAPGGILFVLCDGAGTGFRTAVSRSAWAIHHLVDKALLLEARDERRTRYRQDTSLLFHVLLRRLDGLCGKAKLALGRDHEILTGLTRLTNLAETAKTAMLMKNAASPRPAWDSAPTERLTDFSPRLRDLVLRDFDRPFNLTVDAACGTSLLVAHRAELLELLIPEIADNASKYGRDGLFCRLSVTPDGWLSGTFTNVLRTTQRVGALRQIIAKRDSYLGFLQLSFACEAFGLPLPQLQVRDEGVATWLHETHGAPATVQEESGEHSDLKCFSVTVILGRCATDGAP